MARFCTLFDSCYATRGLVMLDSLEAYCRPDDEIIVLAIDDEAKKILARFNTARRRVVEVSELEDAELLALRAIRPRKEFCWTCTPALVAWMVRKSAENNVVIYVDADLMFFREPQILLEELENGVSILIHEHRFSPDRVSWEPEVGRFNVGFVAFRVGDEALACVERWRAQTIECCVRNPASGHCGDQAYLNEWPQLYKNLRIMRHIGGGVAPWNVNQYRIGSNSHGPTVDGQDVVFFHYHALRTLDDPLFGMIAVHPAEGYDLLPAAHPFFFRPYAKRLGRVTRRLRQAGFAVESDRIVDRRRLLKELFGGGYVWAI
jgi:hypothetical protein